MHVLKRMAVPDKEALASVRGEVEVHKSLRSHPNIVHFIEASATALKGGGYEVFILMEYCAGGGIIDLMNARLRSRLGETEVLKIFGDVAAGLSVMHNMDPPLMHRDLKVENILLAPPPRANPGAGPTYKLCDFGSSKPLLSRKPAQTLDEVKAVEADLNKHTTLQYRAPEMVDVYQRRMIDEKADIWAMGVLLYKLCYYTTPFEENGGGPLAILNARYRFPNMPPYSQRLKDLIASMLQEQSNSRPSIDEVLLRVHRMLGTQPPASVMSKIRLSNGGPGAGSAASASAPPSRSKTISSRPPAAGVTQDLIGLGPSEAERKKAEEEEARRRSEGITPMRRGRPNKGTSTAAAAAKFEQASSSVMPPPPSLPSKSTQPAFSLSPTSVSSASNHLGFDDSFSPTKADKDAAEEPSRPPSALEHSPALPGFDAASRIDSARASPLPPSVLSSPSPPEEASASTSRRVEAKSTTALKERNDDDATSRFPSVEELDRRYPTASQKPLPPPQQLARPTASAGQSSARPPAAASSVPGLSNRASVSAMAGRFGAMASKRASAPAQAKPLPPMASKPSAGNAVSSRWPHAGPSADASAVGTSDRAPPVLPSRTHDWLKENGKASQRAEVQDAATPSSKATIGIASESPVGRVREEDEDSSGDEDMPPEDLDASVSKRMSMLAAPTAGARYKNAALNGTVSPSREDPNPSVGPEIYQRKEPAVIQQDLSGSRPPLRKAVSPDQDNAGQEGLQATLAPESKSSGSSFDVSGEKQKATPPAWDEDDEEMHFLPQPTLNSIPSGQQTGPAVDSLIDYQEVAREDRATASAKHYADAATSPPDSTPDGVDTTARTAEVSRPMTEKHSPVLSPKPTRVETKKDIGGLVGRFENTSIDREQPSRQEKPLPPVKPGSVRNRQQTLAEPQESNNSSRQAHLRKSPSSPTSERKPPVVAAKPAILTPTPSKPKSPPLSARATTLPTAGKTLKPWEREALEKEQVERFGSLRSKSPPKPDTAVRVEEGGTPAGKGEAQERFRGVSSLISQWQNNSTRGAPGWGTVGAVDADEDSLPSKGRAESKDLEGLSRTSTTLSPRSGRSMQHRLHSREV